MPMFTVTRRTEVEADTAADAALVAHHQALGQPTYQVSVTGVDSATGTTFYRVRPDSGGLSSERIA